MVAGQNPVLTCNPFAQHDFLYISDAIHAILLAARASRVAGKVYNIARGRTASLILVANAANKVLNTRIQPVFSEAWPSDEPARVIDIARGEAELGFCPTNDLKQGVSRFIDSLHSPVHLAGKCTVASVPA
jgi:UDP-glucose 4-epimerase